MPCRVGITTDPEKRKKYWANRVTGFRSWATHGCHFSKADAQAEEDRRVAECNASGDRGTCHGHPGGGEPDDIVWTVYSFDYHTDPEP